MNTVNTTNIPKLLKQQAKHVYGWKPSLPCHKKTLLSASPSPTQPFPPFKFLTGLPPVYNQGHLGSCTANSLAGCFEFEQIKQGLTDFVPSRLFIYYLERTIEGTVSIDSGASLDDGITALKEVGVCPEDTWPYDITKFTIEPNEEVFEQAASHKVISARKLETSVNSFKTMINMGYPVAFGFAVFPYMETPEMASKGLLKLPEPDEKPLGGHAVVCVGYSDTVTSEDGKTVGYLKIRNSWGPEWGQEGYFWMPYTYIDLCDDLVVITQNEGGGINE